MKFMPWQKTPASRLPPAPAAAGADAAPDKRPRPLHPTMVSYTQAWLYFFLAVCIAVAWWVPARMIFQYYLYRPAKAHLLRDRYEFVALAYEGVSDQTNEVNLAQFKEQVQALRAKGYTPIDLNDIQQLLSEGKPVPRKSILMTFDQSRRSSYFDVRHILRRYNWNAVMFLWTLPIEDEEPSSLRWPYVRSMVRSRFWEIGAQSHNGFSQIPSDAAGHRGNFLTTPQWLAEAKRYESLDEFKNRIVQDHEQCIQLIENHTGKKPIAFAYPYGDFGQYESRASLPRRVNLDFVGHYYSLGFVSANKALNTRYSDPRRLNRLLVNPAWTAAALVERLERAWPVQAGYRDFQQVAAASAWVVDWGRLTLKPGSLDLFAPGDITGAKMWLAGSDLCQDFYTRLAFRLRGGQFGIYLRASPDEESYVYLGLDETGNVWLRQKHVGAEPFTLASTRCRLETNADQVLDLFIRQKLLFARLNGKPLFNETIMVRGEPRPGMLGFSVWDPRQGQANAGLTHFSLEPLKPTVAVWNPQEIKPPYLTYWIQDNAYRLTHISPPWLRVSQQGTWQTTGWEPEIYTMLAKAYHLELMPNVWFENDQCLDHITPSNIADRVQTAPNNGIMVDLSALNTLPALSRLTRWTQICGQVMAERGLPLLVELPKVLEQTAALPSMLAVIPNLQLAAAPDSPLLAAKATQTNKTVRVESVPLSADIDLSLYYEITGLATSDGKLTKEARAELLRQEGFNAFTAGDYKKAVMWWTQWHTLDPGNEEPLMLIGDAWLRMDDVAQALKFYDQSLEINPGQIGLAIRKVRLLDNSGQAEEALRLLNLYARVFPDSMQVLLAQADWLIRHNRRREAEGLIRRVLERDPNEITAITMLHGLLGTSAERYANMRRLAEVGAQPVMQYALGEALLENDLLARPESCMLLNLADRIVRETPDDHLRNLYRKILPCPAVVQENFSEGKLSDNWSMSGSDYPVEEGQIQLGARKTQKEIFLRLNGSDTMRNGFIEVTIDEVKGYLWLYARRSANEMIRFGFEQTGYMYLQVWRHGRPVSNESRPWVKPLGPVRLRLEIKGDGAQGYVDGKPMFSVPVPVPPGMGYGWWGMAPYSQIPGAAHATLHTLSGGPLPVQIAFLTDTQGLRDEDLLELMKAYTRTLTAVAPFWLVQGPDGQLQRQLGQDEMIVRMFSRYHRIRLLPVIQAEYEEYITGDLLKKTAEQYNVRGFVLLFYRMPDDAWFGQLEKQLEDNPLDIICVYPVLKKGMAYVREINLGVGVFPALDQTRQIVIAPLEEEGLEGDLLPSGWVVDRDMLLWF